MSIAKIRWKKELNRGVKMYRITNLEGFLSHDKLPVEYVTRPPYMLLYSDAVKVYVPETARLEMSLRSIGDKVFFMITCGDLIQESRIAEIRKWMGICGHRLSKINKKLAKENADWNGEGVFEI